MVRRRRGAFTSWAAHVLVADQSLDDASIDLLRIVGAALRGKPVPVKPWPKYPRYPERKHHA